MTDGGELPRVVVTFYGKLTEATVDTGCTTDVIDEFTFDQMHPKPHMMSLAKPLFCYNAQMKTEALGEFYCKIKWGSKKAKARVTVVRGGSGCLLSGKTSVKLGLVNLHFIAHPDKLAYGSVGDEPIKWLSQMAQG